MENNLWILTEERPKMTVIAKIIQEFARDYRCSFFVNALQIIPILDNNNNFTFTYEIIGVTSRNKNCFNKIFLKIVSGASSFVDFLVFLQEKEPQITDCPIYAIEETKTDDSESRNTGVYQRCSKFVFIDSFYPTVKKIMLYELQIEQKEKPTETNIFGTRMLLTLGVKILGKEIDYNIYKPFEDIDEFIAFKQKMRKAPKGNVPINITKYNDRIEVSGRLEKQGSLSHDPNIGALSIISAVVRKLGWKKDIVIIQHGLTQKMVGKKNKFVQIANVIGIKLQNLIIPKVDLPKDYWYYDMSGEKLGTIFIHITSENFEDAYSIFENHAGCEKGYFITNEGKPIVLPKYVNREAYKDGDKSAIYFIPDLILYDNHKQEIINVEGKKFENMYNGISELDNYDDIERDFISKYYPNCNIIRTVVLYGSEEIKIKEEKVGFLLNSKGALILGPIPPNLFSRAINNLKSFWNSEILD